MDETHRELASNLLAKIWSIDRLIYRQLWKELHSDVKPSQLMLLGALRRASMAGKDGSRISELASSFGITASSITQMVTDLEARGYVGRSMDPADRRAVLVRLTGTGASLISSAIASMDSRFDDLVEHLGPDKSRVLIALLTDTAEYLSEKRPPEAGTVDANASS
jgi:DNA-binding MarR family transcriptional regulator